MLFQAVCSEIDVVGKEIASHYDSEFEIENGTKSINRWWYEIQNNLPDVNRQVCFADSFSINPWSNYRVAKVISQQARSGNVITVTNYNIQPKTNGVTFSTPKWWNAYNKVKHMRLKTDDDGVNYKKANLLNLSNAFAALYLLEFEYMKAIGTNQERLKCSRSFLFGMDDLQNKYINSAIYESEKIIFQ